MISPHDEALQILVGIASAWSDAAANWEPEALASLYTGDAVLFGGRAGHAVGANAIRRYFDSYTATILSASLNLVEQEVFLIGPDSLLAQGFGEFSFALAGDRRTVTRMRTTILLARDGLWRIRAHHFSPVPEAPALGA